MMEVSLTVCQFKQPTRVGQSLGSARFQRAGLKAWPLLRIRCSGVAPNALPRLVN